jgi:hypothetical protein
VIGRTEERDANKQGAIMWLVKIYCEKYFCEKEEKEMKNILSTSEAPHYTIFSSLFLFLPLRTIYPPNQKIIECISEPLKFKYL